MNKSSYRSLLKSSYLIGGAQVVFILAGLLKMKVAAVLLGPAAIGLLGLYMNLMQASSTIASLGVGHAGTRQIAKAYGQGESEAIETGRRTIYLVTGILSLVGGGVFWVCREWISQAVLGSDAYATEIGWLAIGVALSVAATGQTALLTGMRHVADLARVSMGTGLLATLVSVFALWVLGHRAILVLVLAIPALAFVLGHFYAARIDRATKEVPYSWQVMTQELRRLGRVGLPFMAAGLATLLGPLVVRALVQRELGLDASGQFQAAWSIGLTYMGLVLGVMTSDFHPRLASIIADKAAATQLVNEQIDVTLSLCAPVLLLVLGLSPWVIQILYSSEFIPAVDVLRWQLLGDVLKVVSFPLGFVLLAAGSSKRFFVAETIGMSLFVLLTWLALPVWGIRATGMGFLVMYVVYLPLVLYWVMRLIGYRPTKAIVCRTALLLLSAICISSLSYISENLAASLSVLMAACFGVGAYLRLSAHLRIGGGDKSC